MRTLSVFQNHRWMLGFFVLTFLITSDTAWSQRNRSGRSDRSKSSVADKPGFLDSVNDAKFAESMGLSQDQREQFKTLRLERMSLGKKRLSKEEFLQAVEEIDERAIGLLNESQRSIWEARKQETQSVLAGKEEAPLDGSVPLEPASKIGAALAQNSPSVAQEPIPDQKPPTGAIAVASFGATAIAANPDAAPANQETDRAKLSFNFRYAAWSDVLKLFADVNDLTLDLNDVPPGTFNYYDDREYSMTEALDVLNGYLYQKGYILVRRDRFLVSLNLENPIPPNVIPNVSEDELPNRGKNELLSLILPLDGLDAEKMVVEVKDLLGPQGKAAALKSTNSLVLTDIGSYLQRVSKLLKSGKPVDTRETAFRAIALKHINATDAERIIRRLFGLNPPPTTNTPIQGFGQFGGGRGGFGGGGFQGGGFGGGGFQGGGGPQGPGGPQVPTTTAAPPSPFAGKIHVTADTRTNHLLVTASGSLLKVVEDVVKSLDTGTDAAGMPLDQKNSPVYMKPYTVLGSDSAAMARMLNSLFPGVVVGDDQRSGKIYIQGTKEEHAEVQKIIRESSGASSDVATIRLSRLDPGLVVNTLRSLFQGELRSPSLEADAAGRRILIRGSADQLSQIRTLLREMGEPGGNNPDETTEADADQDRRTLRSLSLGNHSPDEILRLVQQTWSASGGSPIRVVIPARPSPIKDRRVPGGLLDDADPGSTEFDSPKPPRRDSPRTERDFAPIPLIRSGAPRSDSGKSSDAAPSKTTRPATTQIFPRRTPVIPASQIVPLESAKQGADRQNKPSTKLSDSDSDTPEAKNSDDPIDGNDLPNKNTSSNSNPPQLANPANPETPPAIGITVMGSELLLDSQDTKALDQLEEIITTLVEAIPQRTLWTVFYLRTADATETAQMLERLFPQSSVSASSSSDGMFGSLTSSFSSLGRGMLNATGLNQTLGGGQNLRIITDIRANALFVTGPAEIIRDVEYMLELLDASELPQSGRDRLPRSIPVAYADIDEVAEIIESVFKESMSTDQTPQNPMQGFNPLAAMFGGGNRGGAGGGNANARKPQAELSLGVDKRTSHLIVSCNETMFRRIETMVQAIDLRAKEAHRTVRIVPLKTADPLVVQSTLTSLIPRVTVSATRTTRSRKNKQENAPPGQPPANQPPEATRDPQLIQRMMEQNNMQNGGNRPGGEFPGRRGGGRRGN